MDRMDHSDRSRITLPPAAGEREVADYLDGFISGLLAERRQERVAPGACVEQQPDRMALTQTAPASEQDGRKTPERTAQPRNPARASMRDELLALFADAQRLSPGAETDAQAGRLTGPRDLAWQAPEPSPLLQRFMPTAEQASPLYSSGLDVVDARLGGGFGPGLHLISGRAGAGKTAFIESAAWDAVSSQRPVLYYALKEGDAATRDRLTATLAGIMGFSTITLGALRERRLSVGDHATLRSLQRVLQTSVLARLSLIDTVHAYGDMFAALADDVQLRSREAVKAHGEAPIVIIDDAEHLMRVSRVRPLADLLGRFDDVLTESSLTGLITVTTPKKPVQGIDGLPVQTTLALSPLPGSPHDLIQYVDLGILANTSGGWTGTIPLLLDRRSGVFAPRD